MISQPLGCHFTHKQVKTLLAMTWPLKGLSHGQKCVHLFSDSEAYHEQMGSIHTSDESLDLALTNVHTKSLRQHTFQTVDATKLVSR